MLVLILFVVSGFCIKAPAASGNITSEECMSVKEEAIDVKIEDQDVGLSEPRYKHNSFMIH
jgi:hypothetical protein